MGAYHVLRTPGVAGNGSLGAQLSFWFSYLDSQVPWWRTFPHFILQIDLEKWSYDQVSATLGKQFAQLLVASGVPGWKVTYASRGQYGDSLSGIATPLWNAAYHGSSYPGDGASDWASYSGKIPVLWQYTDTPYDKNAFRGSLDELLALIGGGEKAVKQFVLYRVDGHTWTYLSDGMSRRFVGSMSQFGNYVTNHGYLAGLLESMTPIVCGVEDLDTLAGPCVAGPDPATTGTLDDVRTKFATQVVLTAEQVAALGAAVGPVVHAELAKVQITVGA